MDGKKEYFSWGVAFKLMEKGCKVSHPKLDEKDAQAQIYLNNDNLITYKPIPESMEIIATAQFVNRLASYEDKFYLVEKSTEETQKIIQSWGVDLFSSPRPKPKEEIKGRFWG